jgi:hypothetical protein
MRAIGDLMDNGNSAVQQGGVRSMR